jgi:PAS domain S-box-containing protein
MRNAKQVPSIGPSERVIFDIEIEEAKETKKSRPYLNVQPEYVAVVDSSRKFVEVSPAFCKLLGYRENELIGRPYDEFTVPGTNDIPTILQIFLKTGYMHGIWVFFHRSGTKILVRYETVVRPDGLYEGHMELLGAGA